MGILLRFLSVTVFFVGIQHLGAAWSQAAPVHQCPLSHPCPEHQIWAQEPSGVVPLDCVLQAGHCPAGTPDQGWVPGWDRSSILPVETVLPGRLPAAEPLLQPQLRVPAVFHPPSTPPPRTV